MTELTLFTDGSSRPHNPGHGGYGAVLFRGEEEIARTSGYLGPQISNNQAEYAAVIMGLQLIPVYFQEGDSELTICSDSKLVLEQVKGNWQVKKYDLRPLHKAAVAGVNRVGFGCNIEVVLQHVRGHQGNVGNEMADKLAGEAADSRVWGPPDILQVLEGVTT